MHHHLTLLLTSYIIRTVASFQSARIMNEVVVDIGVNLTHRAFRKHWRNVVQRAMDAGVTKLILTGTSIQGSEECLGMCQTWLEETGEKNLFATVGIHPHDAKTWDDGQSYTQMKQMLSHPLAVAVGECGLDFNRNFSTPEDQVHAFREQLKLAVELKMPLFLHEREAHKELVKVLDEIEAKSLPPIVVHCFTGTKEEANEYIQRGCYVGFTGTICKKERGGPLREMLPSIPLERIMVETDAPFMGFKKGRKSSEPADCIDVARKLAETINVPFSTVCDATTTNALEFFQLKE
jgi:TatD DNase family protein